MMTFDIVLPMDCGRSLTAAELTLLSSSSSGLMVLTTDHVFCRQLIKKMSMEEEMEIEKNDFDGWDLNWYWDNDFDSLDAAASAAAGDVQSELMTSMDEDEIKSVASGDSFLCNQNSASLPSYSSDSNGCRDLMTNEEYLVDLEEKLAQAKDFGYNISSLSSSLNSSSDSIIQVQSHGFRLQETAKDASAAVAMALLPSASLDSSAKYRESTALENSSRQKKLRRYDDSSNDAAAAAAGTMKKKISEGKKEMRKTGMEISQIQCSKGTDASVELRCRQRQSIFAKLTNISRSTLISLSGRHQLHDNCLVWSSQWFRAVVVLSSGLCLAVGVICGLILGSLSSRSFNLSAQTTHRKSLDSICPRRCWQREDDWPMLLSSVWARKFEELVMENAELHLKLQLLNEQLSSDLFRAHDHVENVRRGVGQLVKDFSRFQSLSDSKASASSHPVVSSEGRDLNASSTIPCLGFLEKP